MATTPTDDASPNARKNVDAFLTELAAVTNKYRLSIWGCCCCGSPALQPLDRNDGEGQRYEGLAFNRQTRQYTTDYPNAV
ncbi:hypothetical protein ACFV1C_00310 [Streptomyces sp. NPDC059605]|uniref:hypothetical protein n=1 Tax=Streptomyces sp. NPDC059605 TaxID=3346882 RepID=UPI00367A4BAE